MNQFHKALQAWKGPESILRSLDQAGFRAHLIYRECIGDFCKSRNLQDDLDVYWKETALEYISSGGINFDLGKNRNNNGYYRSPYLDSLQKESDNFPSRFRAEYGTMPSVHIGMHNYISELEFGDRTLYPSIRRKVEIRKMEELSEKKISAMEWDGKKGGVNLALERAALLYDFDPLRVRNKGSIQPTVTYGKKNSNGLIFYFQADNGINDHIISSLPIEFWIGYEKISQEDFYIADLRYVISGIEQYSYFVSPESAVLGIHALVSAFNLLCDSFSDTLQT